MYTVNSFKRYLLLVVFLITSCIALSLASQQPNIILIVADDLGYNDVSFHGSNQIPTPNIDFLGYTGIILNNYYVSPICTPTRSALMTGRHPIHTGMQSGVIVGTQPYGLPLNETILPQYLNQLGYSSHIVGKWHLGMFKWEYTPLYRGFKSHIGYYQGCEDYYTHTYEANLQQWGLDFRQDKDLLWNYTGKYSTDIFKDEALRIINEHNKSQPLFLYLPFQSVHSGNGDSTHLQAPKRYIDKFQYIENGQRRIYAAMLSALDDAVGEIYDALKNSGLLDNSIIVFSTDNGGPANGFDFNAANNYPLRGVKATLWEGGMRGVGLVHSPLLQKQGYVSEQMFHVCDWLPTFYKAAGGDPSNLKNLDGFNSWEMLNTNGNPIRSKMLHNIDPLDKSAAIRVGDYKLLVGNVMSGWDGWYPPYQLYDDQKFLHYTSYTDKTFQSSGMLMLRDKLQKQYSEFWPKQVTSRLEELYTFYQKSDIYSKFRPNLGKNETSLLFSPQKSGNTFSGTPVTLNCGPKPSNASDNCKPNVTPCLYHIPSDPCEYNNLAFSKPDIVTELLNELKAYSDTMVPPGNKPYDDAGNPTRHGGAWIPWQQ
ncbi:arylsulfatase I [Biomphalaria pfeifferi]|uniref:Arylsulfatase I n=1 Tax=Biomphalaria pfeifferi TaxID=112525 RepID=A0AAD8BLE5_BIOPF|nr:arylsulfatase I [Biomphalaria pfeifferi]